MGKTFRNNSLSICLTLLIAFVSTGAITGVAFFDNLIWNVVIAIVGSVAFGIVGLLHSFGLLHSRKARKEAYAAASIILIILGCFLCWALQQFFQWIMNWPLYVKILIPSVLAVILIVALVKAIFDFVKNKIDGNVEQNRNN